VNRRKLTWDGIERLGAGRGAWLVRARRALLGLDEPEVCPQDAQLWAEACDHIKQDFVSPEALRKILKHQRRWCWK
jgi:hypothetical protein